MSLCIVSGREGGLALRGGECPLRCVRLSSSVGYAVWRRRRGGGSYSARLVLQVCLARRFYFIRCMGLVEMVQVVQVAEVSEAVGVVDIVEVGWS